jgi:hypothetical protein
MYFPSVAEARVALLNLGYSMVSEPAAGRGYIYCAPGAPDVQVEVIHRDLLNVQVVRLGDFGPDATAELRAQVDGAEALKRHTADAARRQADARKQWGL